VQKYLLCISPYREQRKLEELTKRVYKAQCSIPLIFEVLVFAGYSWDGSPRITSAACIYFIVRKINVLKISFKICRLENEK